MIIVGLTGGIGHGKTTFANYLGHHATNYQHWESSGLISEVANDLRAVTVLHPSPGDIAAINSWLTPLPDILRKRVRKTSTLAQLALTQTKLTKTPEKYTKLQEYLELIQKQPGLAHVPITSDNKAQFRALQQWLGGYLVAELGGIWYEELLARINAVSGLELATIGGVRFPSDAATIRDAGGSIIVVERPQTGEQDSSDLTERDRRAIIPDTIVHNDGSLLQLQRCANQVFNDLKKQHLVSDHRASTF
jgi:hypothetical protein